MWRAGLSVAISAGILAGLFAAVSLLYLYALDYWGLETRQEFSDKSTKETLYNRLDAEVSAVINGDRGAGCITNTGKVDAVLLDMFAVPIKGIGNMLYGRIITITNELEEELINYQIKITLDSTNFDFTKAKPNGEDIRFYSSDGWELSYWIEKWDSVSGEAVVWVKVPYIPAESSTQIYMYYGDPNLESMSCGGCVFEFFDDFESWNGWTKYRSGIVEQSDERFYEGDYSSKKRDYCDPHGAYKRIGWGTELGRDIAMEFYVNRDSNSWRCWADIVGLIDNDGNGYGWIYNHAGDYVGIDKRTLYSPTVISKTSSIDKQDEWVKGVLILMSDGRIVSKLIVDDHEYSASKVDISYYSFTRVYIFGGHDYWVDLIFIRKYVEPEPEVSVGGEFIGHPLIDLRIPLPSDFHNPHINKNYQSLDNAIRVGETLCGIGFQCINCERSEGELLVAAYLIPAPLFNENNPYENAQYVKIFFTRYGGGRG